ncbi:DUF1127 domain-containing protein [Terasakiella sp. A23]|uniref:DUF1127 domain-containing protein n=1 Tax=Terasakiella sp. FCG-A23 TaxID=3080561 RepID=UPI002952984D|nr:DUF1127 domain-containing protein [Terasakiella sp. A23]MDV7339682.1 DUF1127 domain-containing protein [Terasakiella sp. A23]
MSVETLNNFQLNTCAAEEKVQIQAKAGILALVQTFETWVERYKSRRALAKLDDRLLQDVGMSAADVYAETQKPFWVK